jgi:DNA mismatch endonuclease (patch repair protein)
MADVLTAEQRSRCMSQIRGKDTKPEIAVRSIVHTLGFRFRLHRKDLPGVPDLAFPSRHKVIFVNGCFWHMHSCRYGCVVPETNASFWAAKRAANVRRDTRNRTALRRLGWRVLTIWECQTKDLLALGTRVKRFLGCRSRS